MIRHVIRGEKKKKGPREKLLSPRKGSSRRREEGEKRLFRSMNIFARVTRNLSFVKRRFENWSVF